MTRKRITERDIQQYVKSTLELGGWLVIETHGPYNRPAQEGITDLIAIKHGFTAWIECKRPTWQPCREDKQMSKTEAAERFFQEKLLRAGAVHVLIRNYDEAAGDVAALERKAAEWLKFKRSCKN